MYIYQSTQACLFTVHLASQACSNFLGEREREHQLAQKSEHFISSSLSLSLITGPTMGGRLLASSQPEPSLSDIATSAAHGEDSPYFAGWRAYDEDPYDPVTNPSGVIQMGLAENQVGFADQVTAKCVVFDHVLS